MYVNRLGHSVTTPLVAQKPQGTQRYTAGRALPPQSGPSLQFGVNKTVRMVGFIAILGLVGFGGVTYCLPIKLGGVWGDNTETLDDKHKTPDEELPEVNKKPKKRFRKNRSPFENNDKTLSLDELAKKFGLDHLEGIGDTMVRVDETRTLPQHITSNKPGSCSKVHIGEFFSYWKDNLAKVSDKNKSLELTSNSGQIVHCAPSIVERLVPANTKVSEKGALISNLAFETLGNGMYKATSISPREPAKFNGKEIDYEVTGAAKEPEGVKI